VNSVIGPFRLYRDTDWLRWLLPLLAISFLALSWILEVYHQVNGPIDSVTLIPSADFFERYSMALSGMFLSAWLVKYGVGESIKTRENKKSRLIIYRYIYGHLALIARNAFYYIIFSGKTPRFPHPDLSPYLSLGSMSIAAKGGLCEIDVDDSIKYLAEKLSARFHDALWGGNKDILENLSDNIFYFHESIKEDIQILCGELIPKVRILLDEGDPNEKKNIKARLTDFERSLTDFANIDLGALAAGDPSEAIDNIHEMFIFLLDIAKLLSDGIGLVSESELMLQLKMTEEQIKFENIRYDIDRSLKQARP
jgi:hypothetical protein